jgi:hypothetical protein
VIDCPEVSFHLIKIRLLLSLDDDSVPNTQVNVPPLLSISPPDEHPGSPDVGTPAPRYAWNMSAQPFVPDNEVVHAELSGMQIKHPAHDPVYEILNSDTFDLINSIWKY